MSGRILDSTDQGQIAAKSVHRLAEFIKLVAQHRLPKRKELTIFSLGARGYYENAASDMLAFFLRPDGGHEFGTLFLSALFNCMGIDHHSIPSLTEISVSREAQTSQGNRIDLQILGSDWCLLVENKIWAIENNPFEDYQAHAKLLRKRQYFVLLCPNLENMPNKGGWQRIKYADYCSGLRERLGRAFFESQQSKWHLFAREFILHIENEIYPPAMNANDLSFVEAELEHFQDAQRLLQQYLESVRQEIHDALISAFPDSTFGVRQDSWPGHDFVFRCTSSKWGGSDLVLMKSAGQSQTYRVRAYVENVSHERLSVAQNAFSHMDYTPGGRFPYWTSRSGRDSRTDAITELCNLAQIMSNLLAV